MKWRFTCRLAALNNYECLKGSGRGIERAREREKWFSGTVCSLVRLGALISQGCQYFDRLDYKRPVIDKSLTITVMAKEVETLLSQSESSDCLAGEQFSWR